MEVEPPFPTANPVRDDIKRDWKPFPAKSNEEWLVRLLSQLAVRGVTAVHYLCKPTWDLAERRIGDDMFLYVTRGRLHIRVDGRNHTLVRGDSAHFRRGGLHSAATDPKLPMEIVSLHYSATVFESLTLPELLDFPDVFHFGGDRVLEAILAEASREFILRPAGYQRAMEALAVRFLFRVIHEHGDWLKNPTPESKLADLRRLLPALESLRTDLARPLSVPELAKRCGFSESQFRRVFRRAMGMLPVQYQRQARIERACLLLRQSDQPIDTIAEEVGYAETSFFSRTFKERIGMTPGKYRETHEV